MLNAHRLRHLDVDLAIEEIARDVELRRAALQHGVIEAARGQFRQAVLARNVGLIGGDLLEEGELLSLLEATQALGVGAGLGRDADDRRVGPVSGGDGGDEVGDAGPVLGDAHAMSAADARVAVGHVRRALLVLYGDEADPGGREDVQRVHIGRADDAEDVGHAVRDQGLDEGFACGHVGHGLSPHRFVPERAGR